jgi:hypothetical protein
VGAHGLWQVEELREEAEGCKQHERGSAERARAVLQVREEWQPSVRSLLGNHDGGSISPYDVCKTVKEVCARSRVSNPRLTRTARSHAPLPPIHLPSPTHLS